MQKVEAPFTNFGRIPKEPVLKAPIVNISKKQTIIMNPSLQERLEAIKPLAVNLPMDKVLPLCFDVFKILVDSGQIQFNKKAIRIFGELVSDMFDLSENQQRQFVAYFNKRKSEIKKIRSY